MGRGSGRARQGSKGTGKGEWPPVRRRGCETKEEGKECKQSPLGCGGRRAGEGRSEGRKEVDREGETPFYSLPTRRALANDQG